MITPATWLTLSRLLLLPLILVTIAAGSPQALWIAFALYAIGSFTDFLDGWVARRFNQITPLGTFLDPIIDKVYVAGLLVMLTATQTINGSWIALPVLIFVREFLISGLREFLGPRNIQFPVTSLAKWKTTTQMIALGVLIIAPLIPYGAISGLGLLTLATLLTLITGIQYFAAGLDHMRKMD